MIIMEVPKTLLCSSKSTGAHGRISFLFIDNKITLLRTACKLFANIIKNRLNGYLEDEMVEEQCGFKKGRSCNEAIFTVRQLMGKKEGTQHNANSFIYRLRKGI